MDHLIHRTPSIGSIVKKVVEINPSLSVQEIIQFVKQSTRTQAQSGVPGEFAQAEVVDEQNVLRLARESLN